MNTFIGDTGEIEMASDIIIKIDLKASTQQYCIVETFVGQIKHLKKRTFSGQLKPVDFLLADQFNNLSNTLFEHAKIFIRDNARQIKKNKYLFSLMPLINFYTLFKKFNGFYCTTHDKALHELDAVHVARLVIGDSDESQYIITTDGSKMKWSDKSYNRNICGKTFSYFMNHLYIIDQNMAKENAKEDIVSKKTVQTNPLPVLYLQFESNAVSGKFFLSYNGNEVSYNSVDEKIVGTQSNVVYLRNLIEERRFLSILYDAGWSLSSGGKFVLHANMALNDSLQVLFMNHFEVLTYDHKKVATSASVDFHFSYDMDWFELHAGSSKEDGDDYTHLIDLKTRKQYIELDDQIVLLPNMIYEYRKIFNKDDGRIKVARKHIGQVLDILENSNVSSSFTPENLLDYKQYSPVLPANLKKMLRSYQQDGVKWLCFLHQNELGGCLADDMGLGKTIQAIALIASIYIQEKSNTRILLIIPKTLMENWKCELRKFGNNIPVHVYHGSSRDAALVEFEQMGGVLLTTYHTLWNSIDNLDYLSFQSMILDEGQYVKNRKSKLYSAVKRVIAQSKFIMSGTPFENNLGEVWALMDLINPKSLGAYPEFIKKYGNTDDEEIRKRLNIVIKPFIIRRLKKDVLKELPEKTEQSLLCNMHETQRELYNSVLLGIQRELNGMPDRFRIKDSSIILEGLLYLRQICCHPSILKKSLNWNRCNESGKFDLFKLKVADLQANHEKVVVFSQFTTMLELMGKWAYRQGYDVFYLDGNTTNRHEVVEEFEKAKEGVFFISLKAGGVGLNIVSCQYAIIYDPWWNPAVENQAADRIYRIGQEKNVFIYRLLTADTIEEKIEDLKAKKQMIVDDLLIGTGSSESMMNIAELKKLILGDRIDEQSTSRQE